MTKLFLATACAALLAITAGVTTSQAAGKGKWTGSPPGWTKGERTGWDGRHQPPGWSKGRRTGWEGQRTPPGWR